jgi:hypothetical protein
MDADQPPASTDSPRMDARRFSRLQLLINLGVFQLKLLFDSIRDILLVPVALGCGLFGILFGGDRPDRYFNRLLAFGRRSDRFINLFNQHDGTSKDNQPTSDEILAPYRAKLVNQAHNSPLAAKANKIVDQITEQPSPVDGDQH